VRSFRDEQAAICLWRQADGEPISFGDVKAHIIGSCPECAGANINQVWFIVTGWVRGINGAHVHGRR
jgi:hypothetical protein